MIAFALVCRVLNAACLIVVMSVTLSAHPGSTSTVVVHVHPDRTVDVDIHMDGASLVTKLEALSNEPLGPEGASPAAIQARVHALGRVLIDHVTLKTASAPVELVMTDVKMDAANNATVRLSGSLPVNATTLTWSTSLIYGAYPVAVRRADGTEEVRWLRGREDSGTFAIAGERRRAGAIVRGVQLGFTHILPHGLDHILFVLGLFLLTPRIRQVLLQVTAFTLAHSVTLGLCLYGLVSVPTHIVEPLIALSVAYVGVENFFTSQLKPWRVAVIFAFGLLHGLGFAEAVASMDLARNDLLSMLISFNAGVEIGQLTVIACAAAVLYGVLSAKRAVWRVPAARFASAAVGVMGLVWTIERVFF